MKKYFLATVTVLLFAGLGFAQEEEIHSDIEFGYDDFNNPESIVVESDELTSDGIQIVEGEFEEPFGDGDFFTEDPGFITPVTEGEEGRVNPRDAVSLRFLDASENSATGLGFVTFYNPETGKLESAGQIEILNESEITVTLIGPTMSGGETVLLAVGSDGTIFSNAPGDEDDTLLGAGEIHNHLEFDLQGDEAVGAYGIMFQFESDFAVTDDEIDAVSKPIWLIFNNGMDDEVFEEDAVGAFVGEVLLGDIDSSGTVDFLDISPFVSLLTTGDFQAQADFDGNGMVDFLDISPFVGALTGS